ncbi:Ras GTPase-activating protein [Penicillium alfredii]|uniref:Ras GTPase-activating protein n=1 Tax=Penicillium alfredii TaxID=1506179 RepID=A0A9W9ES39_9EURO|nr:Ras GTPase-activating protein [Penicillium alfredii]KAJ5086854.1 Ras GTPase-activating protein [Penicillium alfredii]
MEPDNPNGFKRSSMHQALYSRPVERRPSKKSSSRDRHGMVYPDSFRDASIRTVTPESHSPRNHSPLSETEYLTGNGASSPRTTVRSRGIEHERRQEFATRSVGRDDDAAGEKKATGRDRGRQRLRSSETKRHPARSSHPKKPEDSSSSIGFPSIQSPRQRLSTTPGSGVALNQAAFASPLSNTDTAKILQLMKTTCGRMHGILSFRAASSSSWTSGYCAINVATGSLIYQAKGEPALAKTLIPDLRGCRVRTLFDTELQTTYLSVYTFTSGLGIQLRPHVNETFDSWLAALLCWQPIRPKGVQNKMTKPQSVVIGDRRIPERRRNSETATHKDATIIKVGKMLLWDKPSASGARPVSSRRVSTYRQSRALSSSWQKVSCTLQENGVFKLFTEADLSFVASVQLSQLSRCAIQQLDSSVLDDEFCIAIYPQYAAHPVSDSKTRPIYLALETRVLFEVWFVLLRAFTIPELYGPESPGDHNPRKTQDAEPVESPSTKNMFRIERILNLKVTEAKLFRPKEEESPRSRKQSKSHSPSVPASKVSDYYTEVLLDGEIRAKTAVKYRTMNPFWREDFIFNDLPPVLSQASILVKSLNPTQKDWTLIAHGSYPSNQEVNAVNMLNEIEVSANDAIFGRVDLRLEELEPGVDTEKWWPILDDQDQVVGEMFMKARMEETVVLMSDEYAPMSELLHCFANGLTVNMAQVMSSELTQLSEMLLNIYQVSGQTVEWISALVEDEIDGLHKESTANRLRYTTRIHSNDSRESAQDREVLVRDMGRTATVEANLLFRGNSLLTKALDLHMRRLGKEYLEETIGERLRDIDESDPECEVDPARVPRTEDLDRNWRNLIALTTSVWKSIAASSSRCPPELRLIFRHVRACAEDRYGDFLRTVTYSSVSGFLFLRFFCPAILNPKLFGLLKDHPRPRAQRTLTLIAKALQGLANMTTFGNKEPWMEPMNKFLVGNRSDFKQFVDSVCAIPADRPAPIATPSYITPIQILGRLPTTSREGFPSLPFLIDHARSFANMINVWLEVVPDRLSELEEVDSNLSKFHELALRLQARTEHCMGQAELAERPSGNLEVKWEELVDSMERTVTFYDEGPSKPGTPAPDSAVAGPVSISSSQRGSVGFFASRPAMPRRSTDYAHDAEEDTPPSSSSATWDHSRMPFAIPRWSDARDSTGSSKNSSTYSLEYSETSKARRSSVTKETSSKYRFFDFVPAPGRRKHKEREHAQHHSHEDLNNDL